MTTDRDRILSEFIDAWNAGQRPDVDDYISRAPAEEQGALADQLMSFLSFAPRPNYTFDDYQEILEDPVLVEAMASTTSRGGMLAELLTRARQRAALTIPQVAGDLVQMLGLPSGREEKTASYLERLEHGDLEPRRVSSRVFEALARVFGIPRDQLEGAADFGGWGFARVEMLRVEPVFRADAEAAADIAPHLEVLADALVAPGRAEHDEVDDLFLGGR